jgi:hypothetical protein
VLGEGEFRSGVDAGWADAGGECGGGARKVEEQVRKPRLVDGSGEGWLVKWLIV